MLRLGIATLFSLLLVGCAASPGSTTIETPEARAEAPDLSPNMPNDSVVPCADDSAPTSLLERGFSALLLGRHVEANSLFQSYKKLEDSPVAAWEADIAIAYDSMLSESPFYDPVGARTAYRRLDFAPPEGRPVHEYSLMMRDALATFSVLLDSVANLERDNAALAADLAKREEAIKRLRELTLGQ